MSKRILITGATGLIGKRLTAMLLSRGHTVSHLGRSKRHGTVPYFVWDVANKCIEGEPFKNIDVIIHLAGAGIADKRWTAARKKEILESRINSTRLLYETLKNDSYSIQSFICASAIGYYGFAGEDKIFSENDLPGNDFLAEVTKAWETEADKIDLLDLRATKIRIGIVLSDKGGALKAMASPIQFGAGAPLGTGAQFLSWIHIDDLCEIFIKAVEDESLIGPYNATTDWCTNIAMTRTIAKILQKPLWLPHVPAFVLKVILGEMADMVLKGSKVSSKKIRRQGFNFKFPTLTDAVVNLLSERKT